MRTLCKRRVVTGNFSTKQRPHFYKCQPALALPLLPHGMPVLQSTVCMTTKSGALTRCLPSKTCRALPLYLEVNHQYAPSTRLQSTPGTKEKSFSTKNATAWRTPGQEKNQMKIQMKIQMKSLMPLSCSHQIPTLASEWLEL